MADLPALPPRPTPPRRAVDLFGDWLAWFGLGRLIAAACCTVVVAAGAYWLVRAPAPSPEVGLAFAASTDVTTTATLAPPPTAGAAPATSTIVVHVAGAVRSPGVYQLDPGDRVHDAVAAAGGAADEAELSGLNLAAPLVDGVRIYVPASGEIDPATLPSGGLTSGDEAAPAGPLDLNRATADQFEALPGVGPATAAAIVGDRERNGPFSSVDELDRVPGIGPAKLAALRDLVSV